MDTAQWPQEIVVKPMEEIVVTNTSNVVTCSNSAVLKPSITSTSSESCRKVRPQKEVQQILNCPRCNSTNTKFCYYNNYSLSQPRYFCKTCRRYWTEGGSLRNIPVGGGSRKNNKRSSNSSPSSSISPSSSGSSKKILLPSSDHDHLITPLPLPLPQPSSCQNPNKISHIYENQDLNLGFTHESSTTCNDFKTISQLIQVPNFENIGNKVPNTYSSNSPTNSTTTHHLSAMELLTGIQSFMPMLPNMSDHNPNSTTFLGFPLNTADHHQFMKPVSALSFSLDNELGISNTSTNNGSGRHLFPFEDLKLQPSDNTTDHHNPPTTDQDHNSDHQHNINGGDQQGGDEHSNGFWNGMLGSGGGSW